MILKKQLKTLEDQVKDLEKRAKKGAKNKKLDMKNPRSTSTWIFKRFAKFKNNSTCRRRRTWRRNIFLNYHQPWINCSDTNCFAFGFGRFINYSMDLLPQGICPSIVGFPINSKLENPNRKIL